MSKRFLLQSIMFMKSATPSNTEALVQPEEGQLDTGDAEHAVIEAVALTCVGCTVSVETALSAEQTTWTNILDITLAGTTLLYLDALGSASNRLNRLLRWKIARAAATPWATCFKLSVTMK